MGGMFSRPSMPAPPPPPPPPVVAPTPVVEKAPVEAEVKTAAADTSAEDAMKRRRARSTARTLATLDSTDTKTSILGN